MTKFSPTFPILSTAKSSGSRKTKESSATANRRKIHVTEARKKREPVSYFCLWGGSAIDNEYDPLMYGVQQVEGIDYETLSLFTSARNKTCLRDLLNSRSFVGEAENVIQLGVPV